MQNEGTEETENSLNKIQAICKFLRIAMKTLFILFCVGWAIATGIMLFSLINGLEGSDSLNLALCVFYGLIAIPMFVVFIGMFTDVAKGNSPFTLTQVKRLRLIAGMLILYFAIDTAIASNSAMKQFEALYSGFVSTNSSVVFTMNFAPLIAAAVVYAFSFVFKYGVLLQEFSDETL